MTKDCPRKRHFWVAGKCLDCGFPLGKWTAEQEAKRKNKYKKKPLIVNQLGEVCG